MDSGVAAAVARFRALKARMEAALLGAGVPAAKAAAWDGWPALFGTFGWSIDRLIEDNGYVTEYEGADGGTVTLASALREDIEYVASTLRAAGVTGYSAQNIFQGDKRVLFLPALPLSGDITYFCYGASRLRWLPRLDFSGVTMMKNAFTNSGVCGTALYDEYELDLSSCKSMDYASLDFARKIVLRNMGDACSASQLFNLHKVVTAVEGFNMTPYKGHANALLNFSSRCGRLIITGTLWSVSSLRTQMEAEPEGEDEWWDRLDDESLHTFIERAYDWEANPQGASKVASVLSPNGSTRYYTYYNFHFSASVKERLAAAYPDEDLEAELAAKGWGM